MGPALPVTRGLAVELAVRPTATAGLQLITASVDLMQADAELAGFRNREGRLRTALLPIASAYDFVFLTDAYPPFSLE